MKRADHELIQQVLDGDMTQEAFAGFQQRMRTEPELAKLYGEYALLEHTLHEELEGGHFAGAVDAVSSRRFGWGWLLALAAVVVLTAAAIHYQPWKINHAVDDVAVVTFSVDAVWQFEGKSRNLGGATGVAKGCYLRLVQGRAGISLEPSVTAVIEGPAELTFLSGEAVHLARGSACFHSGGTGKGLTVTTPRLTAVDSGTEFGIQVPADGPDELHVREGKVQLSSRDLKETVLLAAGDAARVSNNGTIERMPSDGRRFATGLGRFSTVLSGPFVKSDWRPDYGSPSISESRIEGENYAVFLSLPESEPANDCSVLLATLETGKTTGADFHTDGWAGMSFFYKGNEVLFFGDSFGTRPTWSRDVKQRIPVIHPEHPVAGPRTVTLRYDLHTGDVSLHEGGVPLKSPFCVGRLPAGTRFDEIRIGASAGAALTVNSLQIRIGGD
jgi:hypothetical protein